jgi:hypothetical protein
MAAADDACSVSVVVCVWSFCCFFFSAISQHGLMQEASGQHLWWSTLLFGSGYRRSQAAPWNPPQQCAPQNLHRMLHVVLLFMHVHE